jgi:uridylate kinase
VHADVVLAAKNGVDGVYTADPKKDPAAQKLDTLTYDEALRRNIRVMDQTAFSLCKDNKLAMVVFGMEGEGNVTQAIMGEKIGTYVSA